MVTRISAQQAATGAAKQAAKNVAQMVGPAASAVGKQTQRAAKAVRKNVGKVVSGTLGLSGERMTKVDTAWLRMDSESNLMMIVGVWILRPGITIDALRERIESKWLKYDRFLQRVEEDAAGATWIKDADFDIERQVVARL